MAATDEASGGFAGQLRCSSLADLVQLECLSQARSAVAISSEGRVGQLFFDRGQIVHAELGGLTGEEAALEILGWSHGQFGYSTRPWPETSTVTTSWQHLLMTAAQRRDEEGRSIPATSGAVPVVNAKSAVGTSKIVALPRPPSRSPSPLPPPRKVQLNAQLGVRERIWREVETNSRLDAAALLDDTGREIATYADAQALARLAPYLVRACERAGDDLGQTEFRALEIRSKEHCLLLLTKPRIGVLLLQAARMETLLELRRSLEEIA